MLFKIFQRFLGDTYGLSILVQLKQIATQVLALF